MGEIFASAREAFARLGELTMELQGAQLHTVHSIPTVEPVRSGLRRRLPCSTGLSVLSPRTFLTPSPRQSSSARYGMQIKAALQKKAFDDAGIANQSISGPPNKRKLMQGKSSAKSSSEVTLNALNASESEADVEGLADFGNGEVR